MKNSDWNGKLCQTAGRAALPAVLLFAAWSGSAAAQTLPLSTEQLFDKVNGSVCTVLATAPDGGTVNRGSGFVLRDGGRFVTNAHVIAGTRDVSVRCGDQVAAIQRVTHYDPAIDLVLAETSELDVDGLDLASGRDTRPGTQIYVFGSPFGLEGTISPGLASGYRDFQGQTYVQISAPISAGSSGGPVTNDRGEVIGVTVASLDLAQNINFAVPAETIAALPAADIRVSELRSENPRALAAPTEEAKPVPPEQYLASGAAEFRGHAFGTPCGMIAVSEYQQQIPVPESGGSIKFPKWYSGVLEFDSELYGAPVSAYYACNEQFGLVEGWYEIVGHDDVVAKVGNEIIGRYGVGVPTPISEAQASEMGCRWNFSLPGSRFYDPSEYTVWTVEDRFQIDLLRCGGKSNSTFVRFTDPSLSDEAAQSGKDELLANRAFRD